MEKMIQKPIKDKCVYKKFRTMKKHIDKKTGKITWIEEHPYATFMTNNSAKIIETNKKNKVLVSNQSIKANL